MEAGRPGMNVGAEIARRGGCYHGLHGVVVEHVPTGMTGPALTTRRDGEGAMSLGFAFDAAEVLPAGEFVLVGAWPLPVCRCARLYPKGPTP